MRFSFPLPRILALAAAVFCCTGLKFWKAPSVQVDFDHSRFAFVDYTLRQQIKDGAAAILYIYSHNFGFSFPGNMKIDLAMIQSAKSDQRYYYRDKQENFSQLQGASGLYLSHTQKAYVKSTKDKTSVKETSLHEIHHYIFDYATKGHNANWLNEGLSEYFSMATPAYQKITIAPQPIHEQNLPYFYETSQLIPLTDFLNISNETWLAQSDQWPVFYAMAWSLNYYLMSSSEGRSTINDLLHTLSEPSASTFTIAELLDSHYPGGIPALENDWLAWIGEAHAVHVYQ